MLTAFWILRFCRALAIFVCPSDFEKSTPLHFIWLMMIFLVIPNTNSQGARWGQYWGSPSNFIPTPFHRDSNFFVRWIAALSIMAVTILDVCKLHLSIYDLSININMQNSSVVVVLSIVIHIQSPLLANPQIRIALPVHITLIIPELWAFGSHE